MSLRYCFALLVSSFALSVPTTSAAFIGDSPSNPGISAKHILTVGASVGDGVYWIDPDGTGAGAPFQAYCNMTTAGGGWTLALSSRTGAEPASNDIVTFSGVMPQPSSGAGTLPLSPLAISQAAEIRFDLTAATGVFNGYYSAHYHDPLPAFTSWTVLQNTGNAHTLLAANFGQSWLPLGSTRWFFNGSNYGTTPAFTADGLVQGPVSTTGVPVSRFLIYVRESAIYEVPEPGSFALLSLGAIALLRRRR